MTPPFSRTVCWNEDAISNVLVDVASRPSEAVFLATHQAPLMWRSTSYLNPDWTLITEADLLSEFISPRATKVFMPIIGASGTGKSHLIRWLASHIKSTSTRRVISIPKHETNLRSVLNLILEGLDGERFEEFRARLKNAASGLTREDARWSLLTNLVKLIEDLSGHEKITTESGFTLGRDELKYLQGQLPAFLLEEAVRKQLDSEQSVIDRFVTEALSGRTEDKTEAFRIRVNDIPFSIRNAASASAKVKKFYMVVSNDKALQEKTVAVLNHFLAPALQRIYQLGGDDLLLLMRDVRKALSGRQELVLLIEDFALLQGIQTQLLEAFIDDDTQGLCLMRVALAVTPGYFNNMDTVHTRMTTVVSLDEGRGHQGSPLKPMTAAYLNASRWGAANLEKQLGQLRESHRPSSWCVQCDYQTICHQTFGSVAVPHIDGQVGLYPLNAASLGRIAHVEMGSESFNPRFLLRGLRSILEDAQKSIPNAEFPSRAVDQRYTEQQKTIPPDVLRNARSIGSKSDQVEAVLNVWTDENNIRVPRALTIAFGLEGAFPPSTIVDFIDYPPDRNDSPADLTRIGEEKSEDETPKDKTPVTSAGVNNGNATEIPGGKRDHVETIETGNEDTATGVSTLDDREVDRPMSPPPQPDLQKPNLLVSPFIQALRNWEREAKNVLTQGVMREVKSLVYRAVNDEINWPSLNIHESMLMELGIWGPESISLDDQLNAFNGKSEALRLNLPAPGESRLDTLITLEALVEFKETGKWSSNSLETYLDVRDQLRTWSGSVVKQVQQQVTSTGGPLHAAVQLVVSSRYVSGDTKEQHADQCLACLLNPWMEARPEAVPLYTQTRDGLARAYEQAQKTIVGLASVRKGRDGGPLLLDTARLRPLVVDALNNLTLRQAVTEHPWDAQGLARAIQTFRRAAQKNAGILRRQSDEARDVLVASFGHDVTALQVARIADALAEASAVGTLQVDGRFEQDHLNRALHHLINTNLAEMISHLDMVIQEDDDLDVLRHASQLNWKTIQDVLGTITQVEKVLKSSLQKTEMEIRKAEAMSETTGVIQKINDDFELLKHDLAILGRGRV